MNIIDVGHSPRQQHNQEGLIAAAAHDGIENVSPQSAREYHPNSPIPAHSTYQSDFQAFSPLPSLYEPSPIEPSSSQSHAPLGAPSQAYLQPSSTQTPHTRYHPPGQPPNQPSPNWTLQSDWSDKQTNYFQDEKEIYFPAAHPDGRARVPTAVDKRRRRIWYAFAAGLATLIAVGAIVGGVLGSRAAQNGSTQDRNKGADANQQSAPTNYRIQSKSGVWNGTGLAMIWQGQYVAGGSQHWGVYYQDYTGSLTVKTFDYVNGVIAPTQDEPQSIMAETSPGSGKYEKVKAANGTAIGGAWFDLDDKKISHFMLSYVAEDGTLSDLWTDSDCPLGPWKSGNLSSMGWKAPTENRPAHNLQQNWAVFGKEYGSGGIRLLSGHVDGKIHQYSYDMASGTWADKDYVLEGSYAYGGVRTQGYNDVNITIYPGYYDNNTVYTTDKTGQLMYYRQAVNNVSSWPVGGDYGKPVMSGVYSAVNSSIAQDQRWGWQLSNGVYFPSNSTGKLNALSLAGQPVSSRGLWDGTAVQAGAASGLSAMPGTDFAEFIDSAPGHPTYIIYQDAGNSLAWATISSASLIKSGSFVGPS